MRCANTECNAELGVGARFCSRCGAPVPDISRCPSCGETVGSQEAFCGECGQDLSSSDRKAGPKPHPAPPQGRIVRLQGHTGTVNGVAVTPDGRQALSASDDGTIRLWDIDQAIEIGRLEAGYGSVYSVALSPDGRMAFAGVSDAVCVWDLKTRREVQRYGVPGEFTMGIALTADGKFALTGGGEQKSHLWEVATGREVRVFLGHKDLVQAVAISPNGKFALSAAIDDMRLWEVESGRELYCFDDVIASLVATFSPDGQYFLSQGYPEEGGDALILRNTYDAKKHKWLKGHTEQITSAVFSPDGRSIVSCSYDNTVRFWNAESGTELDMHQDHTESVRSVAFSPDGRRVISGGGGLLTEDFDTTEGKDHAIRIWNLER